MVSVTALAVFGCTGPPLEGDFSATSTCTVPGWAMSALRIWACKFVELTKVATRGDPLHSTTVLESSFVPLTVKTKSGPPAMIVVGESVEILGAVFARFRTEARPVVIPTTRMAKTRPNSLHVRIIAPPVS
jgi:hypothetical protein